MKWLLLLWLPCAAFEIGMHAEALYWKSTTGGYPLAERAEGTTFLRADNHWGVRGAVVAGGETLVSVGGLFIQSDDCKRVAGDITLGPFNLPADSPVAGTLNIKYWNVDAHASHPLLCHLRLLAGARYVEYSERQRAESSSSARAKYRIRAIGPGVGLQASYTLAPGLMLSSRLYLLALVGERATRLLDETRTHFPDTTLLTPAADYTLHILYCLDWSGFVARIGIGYELQTIWRGVDRLPTLSSQPVWAERSAANVGFSGPTAYLGVMF